MDSLGYVIVGVLTGYLIVQVSVVVAKESLADRLRNSINKRLDKQVARNYTTTEELLQVDSWVGMPEFFQEAVGGLGFPCGHITQIVGESDTGKTTMLMEAMVRTQQAGGIAYIIDSEHKFSLKRFEEMGGDPKTLEFIPVESLEEAWDAVHATLAAVTEIRKDFPTVPIFLAWDSVAASVPDALLEAEASNHHVAVEAKINNKEVRKARQAIKRSGVAAVFVNHTYMDMPKFGIAKEITKGGKEMYFLSTLIIKTKRRAWLDRQEGGKQVRYGAHSLLEVIKGHLGGNRVTTEFWVVGKGILGSEAEFKAYKDSL